MLFLASIDDYKILEEMNKLTTQRYKDMHQVADTISTRLKQLSEKCEPFKFSIYMLILLFRPVSKTPFGSNRPNR